jgi:Anti-sigma-K factor rskA/Sigma-70, region 4
MATFDQLSAEQRAIIELVLKRGQTYQQLSEMLDMSPARVRELARESLVRLSPVSAAAVDDDWRGQIADYLLNQQTGPESTATKGHLRRSEAARGWARSVLDSLDVFYEGELPSIPEGEAAAAEPRRRREPRRSRRGKDKKDKKDKEPEGETASRRALSPAASAAVRRRRLVAAGGMAALLLLLVLFVWPSPGNMGPLALGGDDDEQADGGNTTQNAASQTRLVGQLALNPVESTEGQRNVRGVAVIAQRGGQRQLIVQAQLPRNREGQAYQVWLYNADGDARSLGAQVADRNGAFQGAGPLPEGFERFKFIDVSREDIRGDDAHGGDSVLRGELDQIQAPPEDPAGQGDAAPQQGAPETTPQEPAQP